MNTIEKKSYAVHKRIEPNLYERNGYFYTMHTVNGKQKWRSLHTTDLEKARRLMQADQAKSPNAHLEAELASLKALVSQLVEEKQAKTPSNLKANAECPPVKKSLSEIFQQYMDWREWKSWQTKSVYKGRLRRVVQICRDNWKEFERIGPYEIWRKGRL